MGSLVQLVLCFALFFVLSGAGKTIDTIENQIAIKIATIHIYSKVMILVTMHLQRAIVTFFHSSRNYSGPQSFIVILTPPYGSGNYVVYDNETRPE